MTERLALLKRLVTKDDADAMVELGSLFERGEEGLAKDLIRAKHLYERAVDAGSATGMESLGFLLEHGGEDVAKDVIRAKHLYESAADAGSAWAMTQLALLHESGEEGVPKDFVRAKHLYERAVDIGYAWAMTELGLLLEHGEEGVPKDVVRAKHLYERAVDANDATAMNNLGLLLENGEEGVAKDIARAKRLYERAVDAGNAWAMTNLGLLLERGEEGVAKDIVRAKQLYERAVHANNTWAMTNLGLLLERGEEGVPRDVGRAKQLYERGAYSGQVKARHALARLLESENSSLTTAFCKVVRDPDVLDQAFLVNYIRSSNVKTVMDLLAGHNLVLLAIRMRVLTHSNLTTLEGSRLYFRDNLYFPNTNLSTENGALVDAVFRHAESIGLIADSPVLNASYENRDDMYRGVQAISEVLLNLGNHIWAVEQRVGKLEYEMSVSGESTESLHSMVSQMSVHQNMLQGAVDNFSRSLKQLQSLIRKRDRCLKHAGIARCILSFFQVVAAAVDDVSVVGAQSLSDSTEQDWVEIRTGVAKYMVSEMTYVDISNFQVARLLLSAEVLAKMSPEAQIAITTAISESEFGSTKVLEGFLREEIEYAKGENLSISLLDFGSSAWMDDDNGSSSTFGHSLGTGARKYFQYQVPDTEGGTMPVSTAVEAINEYLRRHGFVEVDGDAVENAYIEVSRDDEEDVREDVFVKIALQFCREQKRKSRSRLIEKEGRSRFQQRVKEGGSLSLQFASRILSNLSKDLAKSGLIEVAQKLSSEEATAVLKTVCGSSNEKIDEKMFVEALSGKLNQHT